jgi:hypothetical protein
MNFIVDFFKKRWDHLTAPNRTIMRVLVHGGHMAAGFITAALLWKWFGLPILAAGIGGAALWWLIAEGIKDGVIKNVIKWWKEKEPFINVIKALRDSIMDSIQIIVGALIFGLNTPQDLQLLAGFLVVYFIASPWIE